MLFGKSGGNMGLPFYEISLMYEPFENSSARFADPGFLVVEIG